MLHCKSPQWGSALVREGVCEVVALELREVRQTRERELFTAEPSCQGAGVGGEWEAERTQIESKQAGGERIRVSIMWMWLKSSAFIPRVVGSGDGCPAWHGPMCGAVGSGGVGGEWKCPLSSSDGKWFRTSQAILVP